MVVIDDPAAHQRGERWRDYDGVFEMSRTADGSLVIDRADPRIRVTAELLDDIRLGDWPCASLNDGVLRIEASNRTVIYCIGEEVPAMFAYCAEWPD